MTSISPIRLAFLCALAALGLFLTGCLVSETTKYKITLNSDGKSGAFITTLRNIESDSQDTSTQRKDFGELISNWKSDRYLLDQMDKGLYVKERSVTLDHGMLVWKETALFSDITKLIPGFSADDTMKFPISDTANLHITTNGTLMVTKDSTYIAWPPHTMVFEVTSKRTDFKPLSTFTARFQKYQKKR